MVYVQTTHDISCTIEGDEITNTDDVFIVKREGKITGVFDVGAVQFMYLTQRKEKRKNDDL